MRNQTVSSVSVGVIKCILYPYKGFNICMYSRVGHKVIILGTNIDILEGTGAYSPLLLAPPEGI